MEKGFLGHLSTSYFLPSLEHFLDTVLNGPARYSVRHTFTSWQTLGFVLGVLAAELVAAYVIAYCLYTCFRNIPWLCGALLRRCGVGEKEIPQVFLELTFPASTAKSAFATEQLHILLCGLVKYYGFWDRMAARKKPYSLELVGTSDDGIRYILMIPLREAEAVQQNLRSFLPGMKVRQIDDYAGTIPAADSRVVELCLSGDFILPLKDHKALEEHEPMAFLTGHMTKLQPDELVALQVVAVPVFSNTHHRVIRRQQHIESRISLGQEVRSQIKPQRTPTGYAVWLLWYPPVWFVGAMAKLFVVAGGVISSILLSNHGSSGSRTDKRRTDDPYDLEMARLIKGKLDQQLFEVTIRLLISSPESGVRSSRTNALVEALRPFNSAYQSFGIRPSVPVLAPRDKRLAAFKSRTLSPHHLNQQTILSGSELSDLYHFPNTDLTKTEGLVKSRSRELAAPLSIRRSNAALDVVVGVNTHGSETVPIGMTLQQRQRHTYIIGKTGTGKTTLLKSAIYQDIADGKGLAVFDPHGDLFRELLAILPEHRRNDVVVFDPSDEGFPIGLNILDPGIEFESETKRQEAITSMVLSVFKKLADDNQWGPRMEHILRNATLTALQQPNPNLYTLQRLLTDRSYQRKVAKTLKDPVLRQFWDKEFKLLGSMQLSNATAPLTHRLGRFITAKMSRHILLQETSTLSIADAINKGKILLVNLSKGDIGEDQSLFFGTMLTSLIWMAAYQRIKIPERQRRDFFVYVDEFQNFATPRFSEIVSEGRKFRISLIVSHQNIAQIEDKSIVKIVAGNAATMICLKASPEDEAFILPYMKPEVEAGDIVNLAPYHFYMKTTSDESEDAFSGTTVPLDVVASENISKEVVGQSRARYGVPLKEVEAYMERLFAPEPVKKRGKRANKAGDKNEGTSKGQPKHTDDKSALDGLVEG